MKSGKLSLKCGSLIAVFLGAILFFTAQNAQALELENPTVGWGTTYSNNGWYTVYNFKADNLQNGETLAAFCVDPTDVRDGAGYELLDPFNVNFSLTNSDFTAAVNIANVFFEKFGSMYDKDNQEVQSSYQVAIWYALGMITDFNNLEADLLYTDYKDQPATSGAISLAHSPIGGTIPGPTSEGSQDYLIGVPSVPEPATIFLLGIGLLGIVWLGRKKFIRNRLV